MVSEVNSFGIENHLIVFTAFPMLGVCLNFEEESYLETIYRAPQTQQVETVMLCNVGKLLD